jgi:DnaJ homolog subfamily A member 5
VFEDIEAEERRLFDRQQREADGTSRWQKNPAAQKESYSVTSFGYSGTPFVPTLQVFYKKWSTFQTLKSFYGADKYASHSSIYNRDQRRYMEKENKKLRDAQRKEYSDTVRSLALYLKKRDPRYLVWKKADDAMKANLQAASKQAGKERRRKQLEDTDAIPSWAQVSEEDYLAYYRHFQADASEEGTDDEDCIYGEEGQQSREDRNVLLEFYCDACRKSFKSDSQWKNHEKSNKHLKEVKQLQRKLRKEEKLFRRMHPQFKSEESLEAQSESEEELQSDFERNMSDNSSSDLGVEDSSPELVVESSDTEVSFEAVDEHDFTVDGKSLDSEAESINLDAYLEQLKLEQDAENRNSKASPARPQTVEAEKKKKRRATKSANQKTQDKIKCQKCKSTFSSRNALFKHIKETKHVAFK